MKECKIKNRFEKLRKIIILKYKNLRFLNLEIPELEN